MQTTLPDDAPEGADPFDLWLNRPAPRYTSYPPATSFHDGVTAEDCIAALDALPDDAPVSLYIHVPFCRKLCLYCGCHTSVTQRDDRVAAYLQDVQREMAILAALREKPRRVSHLHFGGGTPNIMGEADMAELFAALRRSFDFRACGDVAMELDPRHVTPAQIRTLAACGVRRVSLGVQDFDPRVQKAIQREQPLELVERVCGELREGGLARINFDLIYGLPLQTTETVAATARATVRLAPDRIALFSYAHVPQMKTHQQALEAFGLPDPVAKLAMERTARAVFREAGYVEIGMDHFARPQDELARAQARDALRRNFQGYTEDAATTLLGLGVSSISQTPDGYFQNAREVRAWQEPVREGRLPVARGVRLTAEDRLRAALIERMMCALSCDIATLCRKHGQDPELFRPALEALAPWEAAGIVAREGWVVRLVSPYRMAVRGVCQVLFDATPGWRDRVASRAA